VTDSNRCVRDRTPQLDAIRLVALRMPGDPPPRFDTPAHSAGVQGPQRGHPGPGGASFGSSPAPARATDQSPAGARPEGEGASAVRWAGERGPGASGAPGGGSGARPESTEERLDAVLRRAQVRCARSLGAGAAALHEAVLCSHPPRAHQAVRAAEHAPRTCFVRSCRRARSTCPRLRAKVRRHRHRLLRLLRLRCATDCQVAALNARRARATGKERASIITVSRRLAGETVGVHRARVGADAVASPAPGDAADGEEAAGRRALEAHVQTGASGGTLKLSNASLQVWLRPLRPPRAPAAAPAARPATRFESAPPR